MTIILQTVEARKAFVIFLELANRNIQTLHRTGMVRVLAGAQTATVQFLRIGPLLLIRHASMHFVTTLLQLTT